MIKRGRNAGWMITTPLVAFLAWVLISTPMSVLLQDTSDAVLSIVCDLLMLPVLVYLYNGTRGVSRPIRVHMTAPLVLGIIVAYIAMSSIEQSLYAGLEAAFPSPDNYQTDMADEDAASYLVLGMIVAPICEEYMFRGVLYGRMRLAAPWLAMLTQTALFTVMHPVWTFVPAIALFALFQGALFELTGRLWPCIVAHMASNMGLVQLAYSSMGIAWDQMPLMVSIPLYVLLVAGLLAFYVRVLHIKRPVELHEQKEIDDRLDRMRVARLQAKVANLYGVPTPIPAPATVASLAAQESCGNGAGPGGNGAGYGAPGGPGAGYGGPNAGYAAPGGNAPGYGNAGYTTIGYGARRPF